MKHKNKQIKRLKGTQSLPGIFFSGLIEVELQEDTDGQITLIGYPVQGDNSKGQRSGKRLQRSSPKPYERGTSPNSSGSETENSQSPVLCSKNKHARRSDNSYRYLCLTLHIFGAT